MTKARHATALTRSAERLLAALAGEGTYAITHPSEPDRIIVRTERKGVSVGGGQFRIAAVEELARNDLVGRVRHGGGRLRFRISEPRRAYLRRRAAEEESAFQVQHQDRIEAEAEVAGERVSVMVDTSENPLDWLRRRKDRHGEPLVEEACYQAGERLRRDLTIAAMLPSITSRWDAVPNSPRIARGADMSTASEAAVAARQRATTALRAVGADLADLLIDVCGFLKGLEQIERDRSWPPRSGKIILNLALARLADHYGIERAAKGPAQSRGIRAWRAIVLEN
jgi:Domain of unknown function (DUF6456)